MNALLCSSPLSFRAELDEIWTAPREAYRSEVVTIVKHASVGPTMLPPPAIFRGQVQG